MAMNIKALEKSYNSRSGSNEFWRPKAEKTTIRLLPPKGDGVELPWVGAIYHYKLPLSTEPVPCAKTVNKATGKIEGQCPICDYVNKLFKSGNEEDKNLAGLIKPSASYYANILDKSEGIPEVQMRPKVYKFSKTVKEQLENCFRVNKGPDGTILYGEDLADVDASLIKVEFIDITDAVTGVNVQLIKGEKDLPGGKKMPTYTAIKGKKPAPLLNREAVLGGCKDLTKYIVKADLTELQKNLKVLMGKTIEEEDTDEISMDIPKDVTYGSTASFDEV